MRSKKILGLAAVSLAMLAGRSSQAQPYSNAVTSLNPPPVGYWPLQETAQPPTPGSLNLTAHNSGTLGTAGDGLYGAWYQASGPSWYLTNSVVLTNAQYTGDGSKALLCQSVYQKYVPGQYVVVPHDTNGVANDALTIKPPFSVECWAYIGSTNGVARVLVAQGATRTDCGGSDPNNPYNGGTFMGLAGFELAQYRDYLFFMPFCTNGYAKPELDTPPGYNNGVNGFGLKVGTLLHVVATYDVSGTKTIYTNGVLCATSGTGANSAGIKYVPDPISPIMIGAGPEPAVSRVVPSESIYSPYSGVLDDVAIYTNALTVNQALAHYQAAANGTYSAAVLADSPMLYYRFDDSITPANAGYNTASFPTANNYGLEGANANGLYQPGTTPGVAGPSFAGFGANSVAVAFNGAFGTVNVGNGSLPVSLNPTGAVPLTVVSWFKGGPADSPNRFQEIVGHSDSSYRLALGQAAGDNHFNAGPGPEVQFANIADLTTNGFALNDGKWHMVAGVSDGTNEYLYLDGRLAKTANNASGINIVGTTNDLVIGGDPQYTFASGTGENTIRNFNGSIAHVAFWTNGLSQTQIQQLYDAADVPVTIATQPQPLNVNAGTVAALNVGVRGSAPYTFQWYHNNSPVGANSSTLSFNPIASGDAGNYYVAVTNTGGYAISATVTVAVASAPVLVQQSPTDVRVFTGATPTLYASASGPGLAYQWSSGTGPISGATSSSYTLPAVTGNGTFTCSITNTYGATNTSAISVTAHTDPAAAYPQVVLGDHPIAYYRLDETAGTTAYDYAGGLNGIYTNVLLNQQPGYSTNDPTVGAAQFGSLNPIDSFAGYTPSFLNFASPAGSHSQFSIEAWVNGGYSQSLDAGIVTCGYGNGGEQFDLDTGGSDPNHNWRWIVRDAAGSAHGVNGTTGPHDNYWHHLVGVCDQAGGILRLYVDGVQEGTQVITATAGVLAWNTPMSIGSRRSAISTNDYDSQFYGYINDVAVYNYALSAQQVANHYFASGVAPTMTLQPTNTTVNDGGTAFFYASASGTAPLSYQWYDVTGVATALPNQTNATLILSNVSFSTMNNTFYQVIVSNLFGSTYSQNAQLTVVAGPPFIDTDVQPLFTMGYVGSPFTYSVSVSGSAPLRYQWKLDGANIPGATTSAYSGTSLAGTNYYYVAITNSGGYAISQVATNVGIAVPTLDPLAFKYRTKITFSGYNRATSLLDFPVLVNLGTNLNGYSSSQFASPTGADLRFTDASGTRVIWHEIDEWNPNGVSTVWVQVPHLAGTNDPAGTNNFIYAYWGNSSDTTAPDYSTNGAVWVPQTFENLPQFLMVYHLKEGAFPFADSTQTNPVSAGTAPTAGPGIVSTGGVFDGTKYLDMGAYPLPQVFTLSAWVNLDPATTDIQTIWDNQPGGFGKAGFAQFVDFYQTANQDYRLSTGDGSSSSSGTENGTGAGSVSFGQWHLLTASIAQTNNTAQMYVDGTLLASLPTYPNFTLNGDLNLGRFNNGGFYFHGTMDEARIQAGPTTSDWVWASYMTVAQNSALESYSAVGATGATLTYQMMGGQLVLTWPQGTLLSGTEVNGISNVVSGATSPYTNTVTGNSREFFRVKVR